MKKGLHPQYHQYEVTCGCGAKWFIGSVLPSMRVEICSACHPAYKGNEGMKLVDAEGRVERFNRRFAAAAAKTEA
jgi:large subunit ribosomal protein L31